MISLNDVSIRAGEFEVKNVNLLIPSGEYGILMGKTGSGKTTVLEAICGLKRLTGGAITIDGRDVTRAKPAERAIGFVPQDAALFTTLTVHEHLAFALRIRRWPHRRLAERVEELAELLEITHILNRKPFGLSGGEAQRVALGRALAFQPPVLCLDEPLSALDQDTRLSVCRLLETVKEQMGVTVLHVTHDRNEATRLADRLFRLENGAIDLVYSET